jgi:hypothetical protein
VTVVPSRANAASRFTGASERHWLSQVFANAMSAHAWCCPSGLAMILPTSEPKLVVDGEAFILAILRLRRNAVNRHAHFFPLDAAVAWL